MGSPKIRASTEGRRRTSHTAESLHTVNPVLVYPPPNNAIWERPVGVDHVPSLYQASCGASIMNATTITPYSAMLLDLSDPRLEKNFKSCFPATRESYDERREREIQDIVSTCAGWKRIGKPWFRLHVATGNVFRKSPAGRITVCVPYEHAYHVATLEHLRSHTESSKKPDAIDSAVAAKYTGVDRDHLRFIRKHCRHCNVAVVSLFKAPLIFPSIVSGLVATAGALDPESHSSLIKLERTNRTQSQDFMGREMPLSSQHTGYSTVFWIGCEDQKATPVSTQILQHRHVTAVNSTLVPKCFLLEEAAKLVRIVGPNFLSMDRERVTAHQSIVTASVLAESSRCTVVFQTVNWLQKQLRQDSSTFGPKTLLMLAWRHYDPNHNTVVQDVYARVKRHKPNVLRVFPSIEEREHAHGKIDDIWALDEVAQCAPFSWSFRPTTCDSSSACRLGEAGVLKRTHSCGSEHVIVHPKTFDTAKHLRCHLDRRRSSKRQAARGTERWFHQEFVDGLRTMGEFRVFIVTENDMTALRGRRGVVMEVVHTLELADRELVVTVLPTTSAHKFGACNRIDLQEIKRFSLSVFDALRNRSDWCTNFESLEIGARMDVGVAMMGGMCRYFVNEVTRIYEADFFSEWLAQPGTHISKAVSMALEEVFVTP